MDRGRNRRRRNPNAYYWRINESYGFYETVQGSDGTKEEITEEEFIEELLIQSVTVLKMTVTDFFNLEPVTLLRLFRTVKKQMETEHIMDYIAVRNAVGQMLSNKYKYVDLFKENNNDIPKEYSREEYNKLKDELRW